MSPILSREMMNNSKELQHIAVIMDGNRRWAKQEHFPFFIGYQKGISSIRTAVTAALKMKIPYLTLFAFSKENWRRPKKEVNYLMNLFVRAIGRYRGYFLKNNIRVRFIGDIEKLSPLLFFKMQEVQRCTEICSVLNLTIAINYSARDEIVRAFQKAFHFGMIKDEKQLGSFLDTAELPEVDLLIRTSGEQRLSNFLLWQIAYAELYFSKKFWPEFQLEDFENAVLEYKKRKRNFGR